jgi:hypothetical protein
MKMRLKWSTDQFPERERLRRGILGRSAVQVSAPESNYGMTWASRFLGTLLGDNSEVERTKIVYPAVSNEWV